MKAKKPIKPFLMWVGSDVYQEPGWFIEEVRVCGASKRLPGVGMARALTDETANTVVFLAHDQGDSTQCPSCPGMVECGECRVLDHKIEKWAKEAEDVKNLFSSDDLPRGKQRIVDIRGQRIAKAQATKRACKWCRGAGTYPGGTGGYVLKTDGTRMPYRTYNYWMRQPKKFDAKKEIAEWHMCATCGGTGKIAHASIFGLFVPEIEYVRSGREGEVELEHIEPFHQLSLSQVRKEPTRLAGTRKPGYYAVSRPADTRRVLAVVAGLEGMGIELGPRETIGGFVSLAKPLHVADMRRFRGVKRLPLGSFRATPRTKAAG